jgi:hypothetical protein
MFHVLWDERQCDDYEWLINKIEMELNFIPERPYHWFLFYPMRHHTKKHDNYLSAAEYNALMTEIENNFTRCDKEAFTALLRVYMADKDITAPELYNAALVEKSYFYQILRGDHVPSRDAAIRIILALYLDIEEATKLMNTLGYSFFGKNRRDIIITACIEHGAGLYITELLLNKYGESSLCNKSILHDKEF